MLTTEITIPEMMAFTEMAIELDVDYCQYRPFQNPDSKDIALHKALFEKNAELCGNIAGLKVRLSFGNKYSKMMNNSQTKKSECFAPHFAITVGCDANVYLCCHHRYESEFKTAIVFDKDWLLKRYAFLNEFLPGINLDSCPLFCKYGDLNEFLTGILNSKEHENFL